MLSPSSSLSFGINVAFAGSDEAVAASETTLRRANEIEKCRQGTKLGVTDPVDPKFVSCLSLNVLAGVNAKLANERRGVV